MSRTIPVYVTNRTDTRPFLFLFSPRITSCFSFFPPNLPFLPAMLKRPRVLRKKVPDYLTDISKVGHPSALPFVPLSLSLFHFLRSVIYCCIIYAADSRAASCYWCANARIGVATESNARSLGKVGISSDVERKLDECRSAVL